MSTGFVKTREYPQRPQNTDETIRRDVINSIAACDWMWDPERSRSYHRVYHQKDAQMHVVDGAGDHIGSRWMVSSEEKTIIK